jgi:hypothetical protein
VSPGKFTLDGAGAEHFELSPPDRVAGDFHLEVDRGVRSRGRRVAPHGRVMLESIFVSLFVGAAGLPGSACSDPIQAAEDIARACGDQPCPVGTTFRERRDISSGHDISAGFDPATCEAGGAFRSTGTGACEPARVGIDPCPWNTFPVVTDACFTCGVVSSAGEVAPGAGEGRAPPGEGDFAGRGRERGSGAGGNRTRVRDRIPRGYYVRSAAS